MTPILETKDLAIGFRSGSKEKVLHRGVALRIHKGELSCILGPNGAGKSTLIKTIAGFLKPLKWVVNIDGAPVAERSYRELAFMLSVVLTDKVSVLYSKVSDIVSMGRYPHTSLFATLKENDYHHISKAMEQVGISGMKDRLFHELSDGEKQKVLIAKGLAQDTPLIILDEPTAFLDFPSKMEVMQILLQLTRTAGKTILLSTHDVELALQVADRIWLMDSGKPIVTGCPEDLVLNNEMNHFFEKKDIFFDPHSGTFRIKTSHQKKIGMKAGSHVMMWIKRALERVGYEVVEPDDTLHRIIAGESSNILLLSPSGKQHMFEDIESLINFLKKEQ